MPRRGNLGRGRRRGMVRLQTMTDCEPRPCYGSVARKHTCEKERGHQDECGCRHGNHWINPGNLGRGRRRGMVRLQTMTDCEPRPCYGSVARKHTCEKERGHQDECGCRHGNHWINPERWEQYRTEKHWKDAFQ